MAEIITIILGLLDAPAKIKQYVFDPIKTQFGYVRHYSDIMKRLRDENQELISTRNHLQQQIQAAKDNLHHIKPQVESWCRRVDERPEEIDKILADELRVQNDSCLQGTCTNLKLRYSRSRKATKLSAHIVRLLDEYKKFDSSISYPAPTKGETIPVTSDTLEFDSRKQIEEEIMSYLKDPSVCLIGVWGMGGVGKTIMAEKIGRRAFKEKEFDKIVKAVVSQQVDLLEIQEQLAQGLGLSLTEKAVPTRATKLHAKLMNERILIILDDVWEPLMLEQLGIPPQTKLLLTTRDNYVCRSMFREEAARILELKFLDEEEAFSLFCENVGRVVEQANLRPLAMNVARECKGLPLALVIVGRTLREKEDELFWEDSFRQLQRSAATDVRRYREDVYGPLKLSYDNLENFEYKYLFLLCCLFPEDSKIEIENLVRYVVGLPIFFSATESISEARGRVNHKVKNLVDRCLLMDASDESSPTCVKMHDVIRDMAILIASEGEGEHKFMVCHDMSLSEWPHESYTCISLTLGAAMIFPEGMHCPGLKALFLTFDWTTTPMLLENFFSGMEDLTLLNIKSQRWSPERDFRLPLSLLSSLTKLRVLHLHRCRLDDISLLGQVKDLEILSCRGSDLQVLPVGIRDLTKLKLLDMTDCWKLKNIASGVVSALVRLEELRLMGCPIEWECRETGKERRNSSLDEVFSLKNLRFLEIWIPDLEVIPQKMDYSLKLMSYSIAIGPEGGAFDMEGSYTNLKRMSVCVDERRVFPDAISKLIEDAKELNLKGSGCKGIIELLGGEGFENINSLEIDDLGDVKMLVKPTMHRRIFPNLRHLQLSNMNDLEEICNGHPQVGFFSELEEITIESCAKLKWVFPLSIAESLSKLQSIVVRDCPVVEEVLKRSESEITTVNHVKFPSLKEMKLVKVPMLGAWCKAVDVIIELPSIESLKITEVSPNFKVFGNLQLAQVACTKLKWSTMDNLGMEIFYREVPNGFFSGIEKLKIRSFNKLKALFSLAVFRDLINLTKLTVTDCKMLEDIVKMENEDAEHTNVANEKIIIQKLEELELSNLPKVCYFWPFSCALEFPSLVSVSVTDCPMMEAFAVDPSCCSNNMPSNSIPKFFFGQQVTCTKLRSLVISNFDVEIFYRDLPTGIFSGIEVLHITSFDKLKVLFSLAVFRGLINLTRLTVNDCKTLEDIVKMENEDVEHTNVANEKIIIQKLEALEFSNLSKICYFWPFSCTLEFPSLERVSITHCPMMEAFAIDPSCYSSNMPSNSIPKFFFGQQVICPKLKNLLLVDLKISGLLFSPETPISSLGPLSWLHIKRCHNLKSLFTLRMFESLTSFREVYVQNCSLFEEVIIKDDDEDVNEMVVSIPNLEILYFEELPKLRCFSYIHRDLELPSLQWIYLIGCTKIMKRSFCLGGGSVRIPTGVRVHGISDPGFASQIFFPTQHLPEEISLDEGCFMLLPSDLSFTSEDPSVVKGPSNAFFLDGWKKACGNLDMEKLSPGITYEIAFVIMLFELWFEYNRFETMLADEKREYESDDMPRQQWMEILVGELRPSPGQCGNILFSLEKQDAFIPVALKCAIIRPKKFALGVK